MVRLAKRLTAPGHHAMESVNVITFYNAQRAVIQQKLEAVGLGAVAVISCDAMQGREVDVVLLSAVRTTGGGQLGFLADPRRINVALSRARECLVVLGRRATLEAHRGWRGCLEPYECFPDDEAWAAEHARRLPEATDTTPPQLPTIYGPNPSTVWP